MDYGACAYEEFSHVSCLQEIESSACTIHEFVHDHARSLGLSFLVGNSCSYGFLIRKFLANFPGSSHRKQSHFKRPSIFSHCPEN